MRALLAAVLVLGGCVSPSPEVADAAERGRRDAEYDIAERRPRRAFIGLLDDRDSALDPATGLVRFSAGCCKSRERIAYCDAYNAAFDDARGRGALRGVTFETRSRARGEIDALLASRAAKDVRAGDGGVVSPDGRFRVEVGPSTARDAVAVRSTQVAGGKSTELRILGSDTARIAFADDGSTLVLFDPRARLAATYDLPTSLPLEVFPDPRDER